MIYYIRHSNYQIKECRLLLIISIIAVKIGMYKNMQFYENYFSVKDFNYICTVISHH